MKTKTLILSIMCCFLFVSTYQSQEKYLTKTGKINFYSKAPLEDITADNVKALSIIDMTTGDMAIQMKMNEFTFKKALMQEHFNENYVESDKYPKATFKGKIEGFKSINDTKKEFTVKGKLTIHGVTRDVAIKANIIKKDNSIAVDGDFMVALKDYKIKIPKIVFMNIAKDIKVTFNFNHQPYKK